MKKALLTLVAAVPALLLPLAARSQATPATDAEVHYKYQVSAGYAYTSLNQINQSRYGLQGFKVGVLRDFSKYFGVTAEGAYYGNDLNTGGAVNESNPGNPTVTTVLMGPAFHAPLIGKVSGSVEVLLGGAHTSYKGTSTDMITPKLSFAGGFGGGLSYQVKKRWAIKLEGTRIESSFGEGVKGTSAHKRWNAGATLGVSYSF